MTPEEAETRERFGIEECDILNIPAYALWELCRQFNDALPGRSNVGDVLYGFYCKRINEIAMQRAKAISEIKQKEEK
jgi:hypothetical protein